MMLVDNALNSALYSVWNNGIMLLVDLVFTFQAVQEQIRNVKPWQQLCYYVSLFFYFQIYSVTFLIHFFLLVLTFEITVFPMCGSEVNGDSSLHFLEDDAKSVCNRGQSIKPTHKDSQTRTHWLFYCCCTRSDFSFPLALMDCVWCLLLCPRSLNNRESVKNGEGQAA